MRRLLFRIGTSVHHLPKNHAIRPKLTSFSGQCVTVCQGGNGTLWFKVFFHAAERLGVGSEDAELLRHVMCWLEDKSAFGVVLLEALNIVSPKARPMERACLSVTWQVRIAQQ